MSNEKLIELFRESDHVSFIKFLDEIIEKNQCPFCNVPCGNEHCPYNNEVKNE
jgi:hypothetical protein